MIGAWVTSSGWRTEPAKHAAALRAGCPQVTAVALCVNDNADRIRSPGWHVFGDGADSHRLNPKTGKQERWVTRRAGAAGRAEAQAALIKAIRAYDTAGFRVELFSWLRPCSEFVAAAVEDLGPIFEQAPARRLHWDVEETWSHEAAGHAAAARAVERRFQGIPQAVTTYAGMLSSPTLSPLFQVSDIAAWIVQAYATLTSGARPGVVQRYAAQEWKKSPGPALGRQLELGLPAYRQTDQLARVQHEAASALVLVRWYWAATSLRLGAPVPRALAAR